MFSSRLFSEFSHKFSKDRSLSLPRNKGRIIRKEVPENRVLIGLNKKEAGVIAGFFRLLR